MRLALLLALALYATPALAAGGRVYTLEHGTAGLELAATEIAPGEVQVFPIDPRAGTIAVVLPVGPGGSGDFVRPGDVSMAIVRLDGDTLRYSVRRANGTITPIAARAIDDLARFDLRLSATGGDGTRAAFLLRGYREALRDTVGPAIDLFGGKLPMAPGDWSLYTLAWEAPRGAPLAGRVDLVHDGHLFARGAIAGGGTGWWCVDLAASSSFVRRGALPPGHRVDPTGMVEVSAAGRRELPLVVGGATGQAAMAGSTSLPEVTFGALAARGAEAMVADELPAIERPLDGILGLDLIRRGGVAAFEFPRGSAPALELGAGRAREAPWATTPMAVMGSCVVVRATVDGHPAHWILDTGAPASFLDEASAAAAGIVAGNAATPAGGVSGAKVATAGFRIGALVLGTRTLTDVPCRVAAFPLFNTLRGPGRLVGLLGADFFAGFRRVELDFDHSEVRWFR